MPRDGAHFDSIVVGGGSGDPLNLLGIAGTRLQDQDPDTGLLGKTAGDGVTRGPGQPTIPNRLDMFTTRPSPESIRWGRNALAP